MKMENVASIVSVGSWNPRIFTPEWVSNNVFRLPKGEKMNVTLDPESMVITYNWDKISFVPTDKGIEIKADPYNTDLLRIIDDMYKRLVAMLPHTPISVFGYNLSIGLTTDVFQQTPVANLINQQGFNEYIPSSQTFIAKENEILKTFEIRNMGESFELKCNLQFSDINRLPKEGMVFDLMIPEFSKFLGYGFKL